MLIISESGLYSLVLTSRKPAAKRFKKWVTSEVIPSIRKTGGYGKTDIYKALHDPLTLRMLLAETNEKVLALDSPTLANIASHMRFIDKNTGAQWWILEMNDNQGHRVRTDV